MNQRAMVLGVLGGVVLASAIVVTAQEAPRPQTLDQRLKAMEKRLSSVELPVGTIVASMMPPTEFLAGLEAQTWLPADGRPAVGTAYASKTGNKTVPDLRGVFLRGLNVFQVGYSKAQGEPKDPESRSAGDLQLGSTRLPSSIAVTGHGLHTHVTGDESQRHTHPATTSAQRQGGPNTFDSGSGRGVSPVGAVTVQYNSEPHTHSIAESGSHTHGIMGGDSETRPLNVAVHYYVRVN